MMNMNKEKHGFELSIFALNAIVLKIYTSKEFSNEEWDFMADFGKLIEKHANLINRQIIDEE